VATPARSHPIDRATALLTLIVESGTPRTFASLTTELELARSTAWRLLRALERNSLIQRDHDGAFRPGSLFVRYATRPSAVHDLAELARPTLERLGELTEETVGLAVARGNELVEIARVGSRYVLGATTSVDAATPPYCTAQGKVLYAHGVLPLPAGALECRTPHSPVDRAAVQRELAEVRRRGWAASIDELEVGLAGVAAPVQAVDGEVVAVVSVSGPTARITGRGVGAVGEVLLAEVRDLEKQLGSRPADARSRAVGQPWR
jgi:IclR family transcriptional regulator, acetate operon repressor